MAAFLAAGLTPAAVTAAPIESRSSPDARRASDLKNVQAALASHWRRHGCYPSTLGRWNGDMPIHGGHGPQEEHDITGLVPDFLPAEPRDPRPHARGSWQGYQYRSDGQDYKFVITGTPQSFPYGNSFYDPMRPSWAWMVSSPGARHW